MSDQCGRAEVLAGAIALGEASVAEREAYRRHIAGCARCLDALGGERSIERVMATIASARDAETWEPVPVRWRAPARPRSYLTIAGAIAAAVAIAFGVHAGIGVLTRPAPQTAIASVPAQPVVHVALEARPRPTEKPVPVAAAAPRATHAPARRLVVVHSVITRRGDNVTQTTIATTEVAEAPVPQITAPPASNVPIWRRDEAMPRPAAPRSAAAAPAPVFTGRAESIAVAPLTVVRQVEPVGGDAAINPRPAPIAYAENAYGTTAFEVTVDERGVPTHCAITKSSGFGSLDVAVCKAAMAARYEPQLVNGKAVAGVYRDAFTFRELSADDDPF